MKYELIAIFIIRRSRAITLNDPPFMQLINLKVHTRKIKFIALRNDSVTSAVNLNKMQIHLYKHYI